MKPFPDFSQPGRILVQMADRLEGAILALPVVEQIKKWYPNIKVDFLCSVTSQSLLQNHPLIDSVLVSNLDKQGRIQNNKKLLYKLRKKKYMIYIALWDKLEYAKLGKQAQIPIRIGEGENPLHSYYYTHKVCIQSWNIARHQIQMNLAFLEPFMLPLDNHPITKLYPSPYWESKVDTFFKKHIDPTKKTVLIFCDAREADRNIPTEWVANLIKKLVDYTIILCCGKVDESSPFKQLECPNLVSLDRDVSCNEWLSLIKRVNYYVGPDSGPTQLASFLNKPTLVFFLSESSFPARWGPVSDCFQIIRQEFDCSEQFNGLSTIPHEIINDTIWEVFQELVTDVLTQTKRTEAQKETVRLKSNFKIIALYSTYEKYASSQPTIQAMRSKGVQVYSFHWTGWHNLKLLLQMILYYDINVIQGDIPVGLMAIIKGYVGGIKQRRVPRYVDETIHEYIDLDDYIDLYHRVWKSRR